MRSHFTLSFDESNRCISPATQADALAQFSPFIVLKIMTRATQSVGLLASRTLNLVLT
jgi:hypothetical protein